jgi:hypothetical protein
MMRQQLREGEAGVGGQTTSIYIYIREIDRFCCCLLVGERKKKNLKKTKQHVRKSVPLSGRDSKEEEEEASRCHWRFCRA